MNGSKKLWEMQESKFFFNFLQKTNFNADLQELNLMNLTNIICLHINSIQYSFIQYIYKKANTSCGKHEALPSSTLYDIFFI